LLIEDIWESLEKIQRYTSKLTQKAFSVDEKTIDAVVRNLEIIGEAANRLPEEFKSKHKTISWRKIIGLRNRIVHDYFGVDLEIVWRILKDDVPDFHSFVKKIREKLPGSQDETG
jgi:uncharacterized protein with HEPN domain